MVRRLQCKDTLGQNNKRKVLRITSVLYDYIEKHKQKWAHKVSTRNKTAKYGIINFENFEINEQRIISKDSKNKGNLFEIKNIKQIE